MDNATPPAPDNQTTEPPAPEILKPRADDGSVATDAPSSHTPANTEAGKKLRRRTYRPSHRATFISLGVVVAILAVNATILAFVLKRQNNSDQAANGQVTVSQGVLDKLGVNRSSIGDLGIGLIVGPNTQFKNKLAVAGDVNISGQLKLNSKFFASDASLTQLDAGKTSVSELNINGDATASNLNLRSGLLVKGSSHLQGAVTIDQLLTVNNNINVTGNLSIGGTFSAHSLASTSTLTIGGHIVTSGSTPGVSAGSVGSNGTVSISGNDAAGTVAVNLGTGGGGGTVANVSFHTKYSNTPHVVITPIGNVGSFYISNRNVNGFSIGLSSTFPSGGGFAFDYIVVQ